MQGVIIFFEAMIITYIVLAILVFLVAIEWIVFIDVLLSWSSLIGMRMRI